MFRSADARQGRPVPDSRRSAEPGERLDPVRWRGPRRGTLLRLAAAAALRSTAALLLWNPRSTCTPPEDTLAGSAAPGNSPPSAKLPNAALPGAALPDAASTGDPAQSGSAPGGSGLGGSDPGSSNGGSSNAGDPGSGTQDAGGSAPAESTAAIPAGTVGVPVRLADPTALSMVRPGQRVDLLPAPEGPEPGSGNPSDDPVASNALVLEVTGSDDPITGRALAASSRGFAILIRPG